MFPERQCFFKARNPWTISVFFFFQLPLSHSCSQDSLTKRFFEAKCYSTTSILRADTKNSAAFHSILQCLEKALSPLNMRKPKVIQNLTAWATTRGLPHIPCVQMNTATFVSNFRWIWYGYAYRKYTSGVIVLLFSLKRRLKISLLAN